MIQRWYLIFSVHPLVMSTAERQLSSLDACVLVCFSRRWCLVFSVFVSLHLPLRKSFTHSHYHFTLLIITCRFAPTITLRINRARVFPRARILLRPALRQQPTFHHAVTANIRPYHTPLLPQDNISPTLAPTRNQNLSTHTTPPSPANRVH
jgi:hypothetical protein